MAVGHRDAVLDIPADQKPSTALNVQAAYNADPGTMLTHVVQQERTGWVAPSSPRPLKERSFLSNAAHRMGCAADIAVSFLGEGEWKLTIDVFRDMAWRSSRPDRHLHFAGASDQELRHSAGGDDGHPTDDHRHHAGLLAAERAIWRHNRRLWQSDLLHRHRHDRHDRPCGIVTRSSIIIVDFVHYR